MTSPRITIVTPSYDQAPFLDATMKSVLDQQYPDLEYIVIDGGSTDGSVDIIRKHAAGLAFWCSERDGGPYDALNKGFSRSTGEIMGWLNGDDLLCPWALRIVASVFSKHPQIDWLTTRYRLRWSAEGLCGISPLRGVSRESFLEGRHLPWGSNTLGAIQQESTFWRRRLWEKAGATIRTEFSYAGDFDLWGRFFRHAHLYLVSSPLGGFREVPGQRSERRGRYMEEAERSLESMRRTLGYGTSVLGRRGRHWYSRVIGYSGWGLDLVRGTDSDWKIHRFHFR